MTAKRYSQIACRYVFCIVSDWKSFDRLEKLIREYPEGLFELDTEYSMLQPDNRMPESFVASIDRVNLTFTEEDVEALKKHQSVAYVLTPAIENDDLMIDVAAKSLEFIGRLFRELNTLAVKIESSGIAHGREGWLALHDSYIAEENEKYLYQAFVRRPISYKAGRYTCGMHLLGMPDVLIKWGDLGTDEESVEILDKVANLVLDKDGVYDKIASVITQWDGKFCHSQSIMCTLYEEDEFFYNPFGYIYVAEKE